MPDDNQQNDNLANTAGAYRPLDSAAFEESEQLSDDQVADVLIGDSLYGEEYRDEEYAHPDEEYGYPTAIEAIPETAEDVAAYKGALAKLQERNPSIFSEAAVRELEPIINRIGNEFGWDAAANPELLAMAYQSIGGEERFSSEREGAEFADAIVNANPKTGSPFEA
jgi:hypothetical protein